MYGDEETGVAPEELYTKIDAFQATVNAEKVLEAVVRLLNEASTINKP